MTDPTLLRRAIESVGIEKPSDYTLVLEEVERLMDEQKTVLAPLEWDGWCDGIQAPTPFGNYTVEPNGGRWLWRYCFDEYYDEGETECHTKQDGVKAAQAHWDERIKTVIMSSAIARAATDLVQEMEEMGYGKTSDRALPGSWDAMVAALDEVKK